MIIKTQQSAKIYYNIDYEIDLEKIPKDKAEELKLLLEDNWYKHQDRIYSILEEYGNVIYSSDTDCDGENYEIEEILDYEE